MNHGDKNSMTLSWVEAAPQSPAGEEALMDILAAVWIPTRSDEPPIGLLFGLRSAAVTPLVVIPNRHGSEWFGLFQGLLQR